MIILIVDINMKAKNRRKKIQKKKIYIYIGYIEIEQLKGL